MATRGQSLGGLHTRSWRLGGLSAFQMIFLLAAAVACAAIGYAGYQRVTTKPPVAPVQTAQVQTGTVMATISSTGSVVPTQQAKLTFQNSGTAAAVDVSLGDQVTAGQVLAKLDTTQLQIKLETAQSNLEAAQLKLAQAQHSVRPEELAAAKAAVDSAQAKYDQLAAGPTDADLKVAADKVTGAQTALMKAQNNLTTLKNAPDPNDVTSAEQDVEKAKSALWGAQTNRDGICSKSPQYQCDNANSSVMAAEVSLKQAQDKLTVLKAGSAPADIANAEKDVQSAQAALDSALAAQSDLQNGAKPADLQAAAAAVTTAQSTLALKTQPLSETDLDTYQQSIQQAQIGVKQAQTDLDSATLTAPFAGIVGAISMNVGEQMGSSSSITIVDPSQLRIDGNVDETDVSKVKVGQQVQISFDAIPNRQFNGSVIAIAPSASVQSGVVNYPLSVSLDPAGATLPAGMTANVTIITDRKDNVLVVPNRAVKNQGRNKVVEVQTADGKTETRPVTIGLSNDQLSEVQNGLAEGDTVVIPATTTAAPRVNAGGFGSVGGFGGGPGGR